MDKVVSYAKYDFVKENVYFFLDMFKEQEEKQKDGLNPNELINFLTISAVKYDEEQNPLLDFEVKLDQERYKEEVEALKENWSFNEEEEDRLASVDELLKNLIGYIDPKAEDFQDKFAIIREYLETNQAYMNEKEEPSKQK